jgi:hypothetical protein
MPDIQEHDLQSLLIGTGEFSFAAGATTATAGGVTAPYTDVGNVIAFQVQPETTRQDHKGSYRGIKRLDKSLITSADTKYLVRIDEWKKDNLLYLFYGDDGTAWTQSSASSASGDALDFSATAAVIGKWYDVKISGARIRDLTALTIATLAEGTDFVVDYELGRVRFLTAQSASRTPTVSANAISASSSKYLYGVTPLANPSRSGIGRLTCYDQDENAGVVFDHVDFGCEVSINGQPEIDGENYSNIELMVSVTSPVGTLYVRA